MPIRFVVDRDVPANVDTITLSYAFFNADKFAEDVSQAPAGGTNGAKNGVN